MPLYLWLVHGLEALLPLFDLSVRLYLAHIFWKGGMVKLSSWMSTVMLFTMVYGVPVLPPEIAAYLSTAVELGGSFLLAIGLAGRWATLSLFGLNILDFVRPVVRSRSAIADARRSLCCRRLTAAPKRHHSSRHGARCADASDGDDAQSRGFVSDPRPDVLSR